MPSKRKRSRKAARLKRIPPDSRQKWGSTKHSIEHDLGDERRAGRNWTTAPPTRRDQEAAKRAEQERLQRAKEMARRRAAVDSFIEKQRRKHEWTNFAEIADWLARRDNPVVPNETARAGAYNLLRDDLLTGDFEEDGKSQVRFLHPDHETEWMSRQRTVNLEREKAVSLPDARDAMRSEGVIIAHYLTHCWIPHRIFQRWLTKHDLPMPARFELERQSAVAPHARTRGQSVTPIPPPNTRRRGRAPVKIERTKEAMRKDVQEGRLTADQLRAMLEKEFVDRYDVGRTTARDARNAVLSEFVGN